MMKDWATPREFVSIIRSGEIFLYWCTNAALFRFAQMALSITLLYFVIQARLPLRRWQRFILTSTAGTCPVISALLLSGYLVGSPAPAFMQVCFGFTELLAETACMLFIVDSYKGSAVTDPHVDIKRKITIVLAISIVTLIGDALCYIACRNYKNCFYQCVSDRQPTIGG